MGERMRMTWHWNHWWFHGLFYFCLPKKISSAWPMANSNKPSIDSVNL